MPVVAHSDLYKFAEDVLTASGVPAGYVAQFASALIETNLRSVDSHGVQLLPHYVGQIERGEVALHATGKVLKESGACLVYDAEHGLGQVTAPICCDHAIRLAAATGVGIVTARECSHFGAAFLWARRISDAGYIGIALCDASMQVPPWQGREPRLGTNPISVSVPHPRHRGWLLDMATTTVAYAKLEQLKLKGETTVPSGWSQDREGVPTTDMATALKGLLMPLGGYKGSGLGMMVEILTGVLAGGPVFGTQVTGLRHQGRPMRVNHTFLAIDVERFMPLEQFQERMEWLIEEVKSAAPAKGYSEVLVAGEPEWRAEEHRKENGIPIADGVWQSLEDLARRLNVALPAA